MAKLTFGDMVWAETQSWFVSAEYCDEFPSVVARVNGVEKEFSDMRVMMDWVCDMLNGDIVEEAVEEKEHKMSSTISNQKFAYVNGIIGQAEWKLFLFTCEREIEKKMSSMDEHNSTWEEMNALEEALIKINDELDILFV